MKRAVRVEAVCLSKDLVIEGSSIEGGLDGKLGEVLRKCIVTNMLVVRLTLDQCFNAKQKDCVVRARACALR